MKKYSPTARVCSLHFVKNDYISHSNIFFMTFLFINIDFNLLDVPTKARRLN